MDVSYIIVSLLAVLALLAIGAWLFDQWMGRRDDDFDDYEPYS